MQVACEDDNTRVGWGWSDMKDNMRQYRSVESHVGGVNRNYTEGETKLPVV